MMLKQGTVMKNERVASSGKAKKRTEAEAEGR